MTVRSLRSLNPVGLGPLAAAETWSGKRQVKGEQKFERNADGRELEQVERSSLTESKCWAASPTGNDGLDKNVAANQLPRRNPRGGVGVVVVISAALYPSYANEAVQDTQRKRATLMDGHRRLTAVQASPPPSLLFLSSDEAPAPAH